MPAFSNRFSERMHRTAAPFVISLLLLGCLIEGQPAEEPFDAGVLPQSVEASMDAVVMDVGDTVFVDAEVRNGYNLVVQGNVEWASSDDAVASITDVNDRGRIVAMAQGSTIIEVTVLGTTVPPDTVRVDVN